MAKLRSTPSRATLRSSAADELRHIITHVALMLLYLDGVFEGEML